jgi:phage shock protein A
MKARYEAAEASSTVSEAMTATGEEFEDVGRAIERAEERTEDMEARAAAMDELHESGAFDDVLSDEDDIDRELEQLETDSGVEAELETLKSEVGEGESEPEAEPDAEPEVDDGADLEAEDREDVEAELAELRDEENA